MKKVGVLIHAQFLMPGVWEKVMWGDPKNGVFGVIAKGLQLAEEVKACDIYLCSGIPHKGGREVSPDALDYAIHHQSELQSGVCGPLTRQSYKITKLKPRVKR